MDPVEQSSKKAIIDFGYDVKNFRAGKKIEISSKMPPQKIKDALFRTIANRVIDDIYTAERAFSKIEIGHPYNFMLITIPFINKTKEHLQKINQDLMLSLDLEELLTIQSYFEKLGRDPTDVELETIAQTWSEHCKHKTFTSNFLFKNEKIINLLQSTIMRATHELNLPWCVSIFKDNAGIIKFDEEFNVCFKVETHNHPSAIDPFGGSNTGIGGVIRDILGCGLGAKPILNTDVFCVGQPNIPDEKIPTGIIHPARMLKGVVDGVRDYGNKMGIPTVAGAVFFDKRFIFNPLVFCGTAGILPKQKSFKKPKTGDAIVLIGGKTGRDGIGGATFSSTALTEKSEEVSAQAVQIGNPITEKKFADVLLKARDENLYNCITDCGGGGLSSAIGEMAEPLGAKVDLEKVPLKYQGLSYREIWLSEAQERMILSAPPQNVKRLLEIFKLEDVDATVIGKFTDTKKLELFYNNIKVCQLDMDFLHHGLPRRCLQAKYTPKKFPPPTIKEKQNFAEDLKKLLAHFNIASKEWIIRQYDHEVQGGSVIKPLTGPKRIGPSDGVVVRPLLSSKKAIAIGLGINPFYGDLDPYAMACSVIEEAIRNVVCCGGNIFRTALLDNFCWGDVKNEEALGALVLSAKACYDLAIAYKTPFISGKDSLNNFYIYEGTKIQIPHTLLISAISIIDDVQNCISMDLKSEDTLLCITGLTKDEMGGSHYCKINDLEGGTVPTIDLTTGPKICKAVSKAISENLLLSCHDCSEGGLAVAIAEMAFSGNIGVEIELEKIPQQKGLKPWQLLFSESNSRFLFEIEYKNYKKIAKIFEELPFAVIGETSNKKTFAIKSMGKEVINEKIEDLLSIWHSSLNKIFGYHTQ
jgi:phosphoribosylformylglycinamidine synthase